MLTGALMRQKMERKLYHNEVLYWAGYVYRYWHFVTGESSKEIYKQAPAETMNTNYLMFHCMSVELAIEDLKEIHQQKQKKRSPTKALTGVVKKSYDIDEEREKLLKKKYDLNG